MKSSTGATPSPMAHPHPMTEPGQTLREWTVALEWRLAEVGNPDSRHAFILRRQIEFNRAVLQRINQRRTSMGLTLAMAASRGGGRSGDGKGGNSPLPTGQALRGSRRDRAEATTLPVGPAISSAGSLNWGSPIPGRNRWPEAPLHSEQRGLMDNVDWGEVLTQAFLLWVLLPVGLCTVAGFIRTGRRSSAVSGAIVGVVTMLVSMAGCQAMLDGTQGQEAYVLQALAFAFAGGFLTYWVCGFWTFR